MSLCEHISDHNILLLIPKSPCPFNMETTFILSQYDYIPGPTQVLEVKNLNYLIPMRLRVLLIFRQASLWNWPREIRQVRAGRMGKDRHFHFSKEAEKDKGWHSAEHIHRGWGVIFALTFCPLNLVIGAWVPRAAEIPVLQLFWGSPYCSIDLCCLSVLRLKFHAGGCTVLVS